MPGHPILDVDKETLPGKYLCSFCQLLLKDARQTPCGHFYCDSCVSTLVVAKHLTCLIDGEDCPIDQVYPDNFVRREVLALVLRCINTEAGCKWRGEVRHLNQHSIDCEYQKVKCTHADCDVVVLKKDLPSHLKDDCKYRSSTCQYCDKHVSLADMKNHHENDCPKFPISCPKCKKEGIPRDELASHLHELYGDCPELEGPCPYSLLGCPAKQVMNKERRSKHMNNALHSHLNLLQRDYIALKETVGKASIEGASFASKAPPTDHERDEAVRTLMAKIETLAIDNANLKRQMNEQKMMMQEMEQRSHVGLDLEMPTASSGSLSDDSSKIILDLKRRITVLENKMHLPEDKDVSRVMDTVYELRHNVEEMSSKVDILDTRLHAQETTLGMNSVNLAELNELVQELRLTTHDGILLWKITDFARHRTDAVSGRELSFYSPPFYSKPNGYKMCARIYLNGDGMGRGNSISLFFVIMRGEYDALLRWPFRQKVTLMLLDQDNVEHVIDAFRPDPTSSSFQKPRSRMNVASGCPLFCPLTELPRHGYVRDDTMYVKVIVDTIDG